MSFGKMNGFADIVRRVHTRDKDGFDKVEEVILASVRVYQEGRHGSVKWANLATFSTATDLFRFRRIPGVEVKVGDFIVNDKGRFEVTSIEDVRSRGLYVEVMAKRVEAENG